MVRCWFFGDIERDEAEQLLRDSSKKRGTTYLYHVNSEGMFLVRCNLGGTVTPFVSPFTISCVSKNQRIVHHRVYVKKEKDGLSKHLNVLTDV